MSKNKYKYSSLKKKQGVIHKEKFTFDNSKVFLTGLIICFHIIPLFFWLSAIWESRCSIHWECL